MSLQRGLIADWQARELGVSRGTLMRARRTGWTQVSPHVFVDRDSELIVGQLRMAGVLECGPSAVLAGRSSLAEHGWRADDEYHVEVVVPRGRRLRARGMPSWLRMHHPRAEVPGLGRPARTSATRAAIDAASWARTAREIVFLLTSAAQQRLVTPQQLHRELSTRTKLRNAPTIREVLRELDAGATSSHEATFRRECRRRGLPTPRMQTGRRDANGRRRYTDAEFALPDGRLLIVEIDGVGHFEVESWRADIARHNGLAAATGALILRVTGWELRHDPGPFFTILSSVLSPSW